MVKMHDNDFDDSELSVKVSELLVATSDGADPELDTSIPQVLKLLRERMKMDVVFVSEFVDGKRVFRHVANPAGKDVLTEGGSDPLEESWCQRVVDGRIPQLVKDARKDPATAGLKTDIPIGTHLSTPIVMKDGSVYGTLCCFSFSPNEQINDRDLKNLQLTAQLTASKIEQSQPRRAQMVSPMPKSVPDWSLQPQQQDKLRR